MPANQKWVNSVSNLLISADILYITLHFFPHLAINKIIKNIFASLFSEKGTFFQGQIFVPSACYHERGCESVSSALDKYLGKIRILCQCWRSSSESCRTHHCIVASWERLNLFIFNLYIVFIAWNWLMNLRAWWWRNPMHTAGRIKNVSSNWPNYNIVLL